MLNWASSKHHVDYSHIQYLSGTHLLISRPNAYNQNCSVLFNEKKHSGCYMLSLVSHHVNPFVWRLCVAATHALSEALACWLAGWWLFQSFPLDLVASVQQLQQTTLVLQPVQPYKTSGVVQSSRSQCSCLFSFTLIPVRANLLMYRSVAEEMAIPAEDEDITSQFPHLWEAKWISQKVHFWKCWLISFPKDVNIYTWHGRWKTLLTVLYFPVFFMHSEHDPDLYFPRVVAIPDCKIRNTVFLWKIKK